MRVFIGSTHIANINDKDIPSKGDHLIINNEMFLVKEIVRKYTLYDSDMIKGDATVFVESVSTNTILYTIGLNK